MRRRSRQVGRQIQETLGIVLEREVRDPRLDLVTVTDVQVTNDMRQARVFISVLEEERQGDVLRALRKATGFLRHELSARLNLRYIPTLTFTLDHSVAHAQHLLNILDEIAAEQES